MGAVSDDDSRHEDNNTHEYDNENERQRRRRATTTTTPMTMMTTMMIKVIRTTRRRQATTSQQRRKSFIFIDPVDVLKDFGILSNSLSCISIFTDFWSFWDLPRHQKGVHRSRFSPIGGVLGGIWAPPYEFLTASWATKRPSA